MNFIFNEKKGVAVGRQKRKNDSDNLSSGFEIEMDCDDDGRVLPFAELRSELFCPTRIDIKQTHNISCRLAEEAASIFLIEFRDERKATAGYLSSIQGMRSCAKISEEVRKAGLNQSASNSISESNHAGLTRSIEMYGTIRLDNAATEA